MKSLSLTIALLAVMATALLASPLSASAHARYKSSTPGKGEVVRASPARVEITFTQDIQKVGGTYGIEVTKDRGASVTAGPAVVDEQDRSKLSVPLQPNLDPGRYVVNYKNVSDEDGDPFNGAFSFYLNYQANAVDLENDRQLEAVGAELETPGATSSPAGNPTASGTAVATQPTRAATPTTSPGNTGGGGDNNTTIYIVVGGVAVGIVIGFGIWRFLLRPRGR
jgi:hypothetical protein